MKLRKILSLALAAAMVLGLCACGDKPMDAPTLMEKMTRALADAPISGVNAELTADMKINLPGMGMSVAMGLEAELRALADQEQGTGYLSVDLAVEAMGQTEQTRTEIYLVEEEGERLAYCYESQEQTWTCRKTDEGEDSLKLSDLTPTELTLAEETQMIGKTEAYVLSGLITGGQAQRLLDQGLEGLAEEDREMLEAMDLTGLEVPVVLYVDRETFLPLQMEVKAESMGQVMTDAFAAMMEASGLGIRVDMEVEFQELSLLVTDITCGGAEIPALPREAVNNAERLPIEAGDSYTITHGEDCVSITTPEGYMELHAVTNFLGLMSDDGDIQVSYVLEDQDWETLRGQVQTDAEAMIQDGTCERWVVDTMQGYDVIYTEMADGSAVYYACRQVGDSWLHIEVRDATAWDMVYTMSPILRAVSE